LRAKNIKPNKKGSVAPYLFSSFATLPFSSLYYLSLQLFSGLLKAATGNGEWRLL